tara:strand:+ start:1259 stop:1651 length:393 start_codon:yes stop_codon:yes gene_type:complete
MPDSEINTAILERLESVVISLQDNSIKMGQLLAVHAEKLEQQEKTDDILFSKIDHLHKDLHQSTTEIKKGCERDILLVNDRLGAIEKKMWSIAGALTVISFLVSAPGQAFIRTLTPSTNATTMGDIVRSM